MHTQRPFFKLGYFAIPILALTVLMGYYFPSSGANGYKSGIIAFEFAETAADVKGVLAPLGETGMRNMNTGNYIDFLFMIVYAVFLFLWAAAARKHFHAKWLIIAQVFAVIILVGDIFENVQLLRICNTYMLAPTNTDVLSPWLHQLQIFTWLKWSSIAATLFLIGTALVKGNWLAKIIGILISLPIGLFVMAMLMPSIQMTDNFALSSVMGIGILIISSFLIKNKHHGAI